jgi:ParB family chromosome partitioning protein
VSNVKSFTYRGDVRALAAWDGTLAFVTVHPEGRPTAVYRLDPEKLTLSEVPLPAGGAALLATDEGLWIASSDGFVYFLSAKAKSPARRGPQFSPPPVALAPLAGERLAVATGPKVAVLARKDGSVTQTLELPEAVTCLAADPTGQWLAAGTAKGTVAIYECESAPEFRLSDSAPLHEAAVTALLFEPDELRFLSAGADQKLLSTHARGRLEAEDRGRGANHTEPITAMVPGVAERFLTGSTDATVKSWPRGKGARPVTLKDGVAKVSALAVVQVHGKPQVVVACEDNTLRFFQLDEEGKFGEEGDRVHGVEGWARWELSQDPPRREAALRTLAGFGDEASVKRIAAQMTADGDHALRLLACKLLAESSHPRVSMLLEKGLQHKDEAVRVTAFDGLRRHAGPQDLRPLVLALKAGKADVGLRAVQALEELAPKDDQAMARLVGALEEKVPEVRRAALGSLEKVHGADSPQASLTALAAPHADLRRLALVRLFQRKLLHDPRAQAALRWRGEDQDPEVRRVAFLLSLYTREKLLEALRTRDTELDRQLTELESGTLPEMATAEEKEAPPEETPEPTEEAPAAPQETPALPAGVPGAITQEAMLARLEELGRQGAFPAPLLQRMRQMLAGGAGAPAGILNMLRAQIEALTRRGQEPVEEELEEEEPEEGEPEES